ncbi:MAG: adenylate/guanylate cyclase domain-containing protein [Actinobacteria bacterium]|nr:adenylate/guanylate cyclase domain-containing protein [Actinomycetota bacterium]
MARISGTELARRAGTTLTQVERLVELEILAHDDGDAFGLPDIQRVRLVRALDDAGISPESLGRAISEGHLSFGFVDTMWPEPPALTERTFRSVASDLDFDPDALVRLYSMWGLPRPSPDESVREDDAAIFADFGVSIPADALNELTMMRSARTLGESLRKVADTARSFFNTYFEEPALKNGMSRQQIIDMLAQVNSFMGPSLDRWVLWLLHRHSEHNQTEYIIEHVEIAVDKSSAGEPRAHKSSAIVFFDLTGYTQLTEERGDAAAADFALRLAELVQEVAARYNGRPVKLLGDGVMLHFAAPPDAVMCAFELVDRTLEAGLPPAHVGVNAGPVIVRDGDYFGRTVNIASRIADYARSHEILVTPEVKAATGAEPIQYESIGPVLLQGVRDKVTLFLATRADMETRTGAGQTTARGHPGLKDPGAGQTLRET